MTYAVFPTCQGLPLRGGATCCRTQGKLSSLSSKLTHLVMRSTNIKSKERFTECIPSPCQAGNVTSASVQASRGDAHAVADNGLASSMTEDRATNFCTQARYV